MNNLLNVALSVLPKQKITWLAFDSMGSDDRGRPVVAYKEPETIWASKQPLDARDYEQYGLDVNKSYYQIWASKELKSSEKNGAPDKFTAGDLELEAVSGTNWHEVNGWRTVLCVKI